MRPFVHTHTQFFFYCYWLLFSFAESEKNVFHSFQPTDFKKFQTEHDILSGRISTLEQEVSRVAWQPCFIWGINVQKEKEVREEVWGLQVLLTWKRTSQFWTWNHWPKWIKNGSVWISLLLKSVWGYDYRIRSKIIKLTDFDLNF